MIDFLIFGPKMGPKGTGRASIGSRDGFRFIWTKFQPKWAHLVTLGSIGPLFVFQFHKKTFWAQIAPSPVWVQGPYGPTAPSHMGPGAHMGLGPGPIYALDPDSTWNYLGPKCFFLETEKNKGPIGSKMGQFGLKLGPTEA